MPKKNANPTVAYTVRLTTDDKKWLDDMSLRTKVPVPTLLTWAIAALRQYAEAHGGIIPTPVDIRTLWAIAQALLLLGRRPAKDGL